jgi:hypothetical protein
MQAEDAIARAVIDKIRVYSTEVGLGQLAMGTFILPQSPMVLDLETSDSDRAGPVGGSAEDSGKAGGTGIDALHLGGA